MTSSLYPPGLLALNASATCHGELSPLPPGGHQAPVLWKEPCRAQILVRKTGPRLGSIIHAHTQRQPVLCTLDQSGGACCCWNRLLWGVLL